jgi:hypothetical protein
MKVNNVLKELERSLNHTLYVGRKSYPENSISYKRYALATNKLNQTVIKGISHRKPNSINQCLQYFEKEKEQAITEKILPSEVRKSKLIFDSYGERKNFVELEGELEKWKKCQSLAKKNEVLQTHFIFATKEKPTEENEKKLIPIMKNIQDTFRLNNQKSMFSIHRDKNFLHAHIIVNKFNHLGEKKFIGKNFLLTIKEQYKNLLNNAYGQKYTVLSKKFTINKESEKKIKHLKKIEKSFGEEGLEYYEHLSFKIKIEKDELKKKKYQKEKKMFLKSISSLDPSDIEKTKRKIVTNLELRKKGMLKKKIKQIFPKDKKSAEVIDFLYARKKNIFTNEIRFGNRNKAEIKTIKNFLQQVAEGKKDKFLINTYENIREKIANYKKHKKRKTDYGANMKYLENLLIDKKFFRNQTKNLPDLEKRIYEFYKNNKDFQYIKNSTPKNKANFLPIYLAKKIEDPLLAKYLLKELIKYNGNIKPEKEKIRDQAKQIVEINFKKNEFKIEKTFEGGKLHYDAITKDEKTLKLLNSNLLAIMNEVVKENPQYALKNDKIQQEIKKLQQIQTLKR